MYISNLLEKSLPLMRSGRVHSVFTNSMNIAIGGELMHIGKDEHPLSPYGLTVSCDLMRVLLKKSQVGDLVKNELSGLCVYTQTGTLTIPLMGRAVKNLAIPKLDKTVAPSCKKMHQRLSELDFRPATGLVWDANVEQHLEQLGDEKNIDWTDTSMFRFFLGRGKGLTPSGDDLLVAYIATRKTFGLSVWNSAFLLSEVHNRTTDVSVMFYKALCCGFVSESLYDLLLALKNVEAERSDVLIKNMLSIGYTSGWDTLLGFFLGLKSVIKSLSLGVSIVKN